LTQDYMVWSKNLIKIRYFDYWKWTCELKKTWLICFRVKSMSMDSITTTH
jgi:hypothetical protein